MTKKILLFFLVFIILFGTAELVFIQPSVGRNLEIEYPEVAGEQPEKVITPVPEYVRYIYNALIWLSGLIALIVLPISLKAISHIKGHYETTYELIPANVATIQTHLFTGILVTIGLLLTKLLFEFVSVPF